MSSQLHQAVELAQAGQRDQARQLLLQFLQNEPNHEVAWLWLASVAGDQAEYQRALNEVLRINPTNQRAQNLLAEFHQQQQLQQAAAPPPPTPPPQYYTPPPSSEAPVSTPPPSFASTPPPPGAYMQPVQQAMPPQPVRVEREIVTRRRGGCLGCSGCLGCGGCGCGQGCLLAFLVMIVVPFLACGALSFSAESMGPFDMFARHLPGEFGRKELAIETGDLQITTTVPRSWFEVDEDDPTWQGIAELYDAIAPFEDTTIKWADMTSGSDIAVIIDVDYLSLTQEGDISGMRLVSSSTPGNFACSAVRVDHSGSGEMVYEYDNGLCGYRVDSVISGPTSHVIQNIDPPEQTRRIDFYTPVNEARALYWEIRIPENLYLDWEDDINAVIESMSTSFR